MCWSVCEIYHCLEVPLLTYVRLFPFSLVGWPFLLEGHVIILSLCPGRKSSTCHFVNLSQYDSLCSLFSHDAFSILLLLSMFLVLCTVIKSPFCTRHTHISLSLSLSPTLLSSLPVFISLLGFCATDVICCFFFFVFFKG